MKNCKSFEDARSFAHSLKLKSQDEWLQYCKSGEKPFDIPRAAHKIYAGKGWNGYGDWLGTGTVATALRKYRSFEEAKAFVHILELKNAKEWERYCKSGKRPDDIPATPHLIYKEKGWKGYRDWLGKINPVKS